MRSALSQAERARIFWWSFAASAAATTLTVVAAEVVIAMDSGRWRGHEIVGIALLVALPISFLTGAVMGAVYRRPRVAWGGICGGGLGLMQNLLYFKIQEPNTPIDQIFLPLLPVAGWCSFTFAVGGAFFGFFFNRGRQHPHLCTCGYNLFGLAAPRCPECGTLIPLNPGNWQHRPACPAAEPSPTDQHTDPHA